MQVQLENILNQIAGCIVWLIMKWKFADRLKMGKESLNQLITAGYCDVNKKRTVYIIY